MILWSILQIDYMMTRVVSDLFLQYICASCILLVPLLAQWDRVCTSEMTQTHGLCGDKLTEVLETICDGNYATPMFKRNNGKSYAVTRVLELLCS